MNDFERVKENFDLLEVAGRYTHLKRSGKEFVGLCPIHSEKTPSFYVNREKQQFYCYGCAAGGDVIELVRLIQNTDVYTALEMLAEENGIALSTHENEGYQRRKDFQRRQASLIDKATDTLSRKQEAVEYLVNRGITQAAVDKFRIGYGEKNHSVIIPLLDHRNMPIGYAERFIGEPPPGFSSKYRLPSEDPKSSSYNELFRKSEFLFNEYNARLALKKDHYLLVFEGQLDVISADQIGFHASVACMQSSLTVEQAKRIIKLAEDNTVIVLVPDKNEAGMKSVKRNADVLRNINAKIPIRVLKLPERLHESGKEFDMNDFVRDGLNRETATSMIDVVEIALIDLMIRQTPDIQLQQEYARDIAAKVETPVVQERLANYLAECWGIDRAKVDAFLKVRREVKLYEHFKDIDDMYESFMNKVFDSGRNNLTLGYAGLDKIINSGMGIPTGWVVDFLARSSVGKTAFALNVISNAVERHKVGCMFFSFEQQDSDIYPKIASIRTRMSQKQILQEYSSFNSDTYHQELHRDLKHKLLVFERERLNLQQIEELICWGDEHYFQEAPNKLILIDYLGYIKANKVTNKYEGLSELTSELKQVAKRTNKVFIVLVQTSRKGGDGSEPVNFEDARDSGTIEENADVLIGAYRPELKKDLGSHDILEVLDDYMVQLLKNRNGPVGLTFRLKFEKSMQIIREWGESEKKVFIDRMANEIRRIGTEEERILFLRNA